MTYTMFRNAIVAGACFGALVLAACGGGGGSGGGAGGGGGVTPPTATPGIATVTIIPATNNVVRGSTAAGARGAMLVGMSSAGDQAAVGAAGVFATTSLLFGTGTSAQNLARLPATIGAAREPAIAQWDRPRDDASVHALIASFRRASGSARMHTSSVFPQSPSAGAQANIWVSTGSVGGTSQYKQVASSFELQTAHANIWIDNTLLSGAYASFAGGTLGTTLQTLGNAFENAYASDLAHFGSPDYASNASGITTVNACDASGAIVGTTQSIIAEPADGRINIVVLNSVGGYFSGLNYVPQAALNCSSPVTRYSNEAPIVYLGWFDQHPQLELGEDVVRSSAHQLQHLINFVNHQVTTSAAPEDLWVNEGLSTLSQDLAVNRMYPAEPFDALDALFHAAEYLATPQQFSITGFIGIDAGASGASYNCGGCYGGAYLVQRYLYDRFGGDAYSHGMESSGKSGFANLVANCGGCNETGQQLLQDFAVSMAVNSMGLRPPSAQYTFGTLNLRYGQYPSQVDGFTSQPLNGVATFSLAANGSLGAVTPLGGFSFVTLTAPAGQKFSIVDTTPANNYGLVGGLIQY